MIQLLPKCLQLTYDREREDDFVRMYQALEECLITNRLNTLGIVLEGIKSFQSVHQLKQNEKEKLFVLFTYFLTQKYVYKTRYVFSDNLIMRKMIPILAAIVPSLSKKCQVNWIDLDRIYHDITINDSNNIQVNKDQKQQSLKNLERFTQLLYHLIPTTQYEEIFRAYLNGSQNARIQYVKVKSSEPTTLYQESFQMLMELKCIPTTCKIIQDQQLRKLIINKPDLPIDEHLDRMLDNVYSNFVAFVPNKQQIEQVIVCNSSRIAQQLVNLLAPISKFKNRIKVWEIIERFIIISNDLLHPNNAMITIHIKIITEFLLAFIRAFTQRVQKEQHKQEQLNKPKLKKEPSEIQGTNNLNYQEHFFIKEENTGMAQMYEEDDIEQIENESDDDSDNDEVDYKDYAIDDDGIQRFITLVKPLVKYLIYMKDQNKSQIGSIFKALCKFRPLEFLPEIIDQMTVALQRQDMKPHTLITIYEKILPYMLESYSLGIAHVPFILRQSIEFINDYGELIWRFYDILFQYVPIYDERDLLKLGKDLDQEMNINDLNIREITQEISDLALEAFRKYVQSFEYIDSKYNVFLRLPNIFFSTRNKFFNFIFQCSPTNFKEAINIVGDYLDDKLLTKPHTLLIQTLQAITLRQPQELLINILLNKIIRSKGDTYEFSVSNFQQLNCYITILSEMIQFAGPMVKQFYPQLKKIIQLAFDHESVDVQGSSQDLLSVLLLSQIAVHVCDLSRSKEINLKWAQYNKDKNNEQKYIPSWRVNEDQQFLKIILDDFYYPSLHHVQNFIKEKKTVNTNIEEYVTKEFSQIISLLNEPLCSKNMLEVDHKIRRDLAKHLEVLGVCLTTLFYRCKQIPDKQNSLIFLKFQEQYSLPVLDKMFPELFEIIVDMIFVYVSLGLSQDNRVVQAYYQLRKAFLGELSSSEKLINLQRWLSYKAITQGNLGKRYHLLNNYQKGLLATFQVNARVEEIFSNEPVNDYLIKILYLWVILIFDQNESTSKSHTQYFNWYMPQFKNHTWFKELGLELLKPLVNILKGQNFNQQYIDQLSEIEKPKIAIFQRSFFNGLTNFLGASFEYIGEDICDMYIELEQIYQVLINKTFKSTFNHRLIGLQLNIQKLFHKQNLTDYIEKQTILQIKDENLATYLDEIHLKRQEHHMTQLQEIKNVDEIVNKKKSKMINAWVNFTQDQNNSRQSVVLGIPMFIVSNSNDLTRREDIIRKASLSCTNPEFNIRSLGRALLYKLFEITKKSQTQYTYEQVGDEEWNKKITAEEYLVTRGLLQNDRESILTDHLRKGVFTKYDVRTTVKVNYEEVRKQLKPILEKGEEIMCYLMIDLGVIVNVDLAQLQGENKDYANIFNDVNTYLVEKLGSKHRMNKQAMLPQINLFKFMKLYFQVDNYEIFDTTKKLLDNTQLEDKDAQAFQRFYIGSLLSAIHSSWPISEEKKDEILDFCLNYIDQMIEKQSRELIQHFNYHMYYTFQNKDIRHMQSIIKKIHTRILESQDNEVKQVRWLNVLTYILAEKRTQSMNLLEDLFTKLVPNFNHNKMATSYFQQLFYLGFMKPHGVKLLEQLGLTEQIQQKLTLTKGNLFFTEERPLFTQILGKIMSDFSTMDLHIRKNINQALLQLFKSMSYQYVDIETFKKFNTLLKYLLTFNEENVQNEQETQSLNQIITTFAQLVGENEYAIECVQMTLDLIKDSNGKVRQRQLNFLKIILRQNRQLSRIDVLIAISQYLNEDTKQVQDLCYDLITQQIQSMCLNELNEIRVYFQSQIKTNPIISKLVLMALVIAHPRRTFIWTNEILAIILAKCNPLLQKQKDFASEFLKMFKTNLLVENEEYQIDIECIEKMSELSNPYNYFA